jgi:NADH-quinone oxidoreductase subunit M
MQQHDARLLLAWHGVGQGGYMLLGVVIGDALGSAGGILHMFNYAACQAALFMTVFAVSHRTGTSDLNRLGGLVTRMPLSFLVMLFGIIGLAGLPPMNGFVSKWLIYRSLLDQGMPLLFVATVIGTLGTILSVYKLIHNTFLGQLRVEHEGVREVPLSMLVPMLVLALIIMISGVFPGLVLAGVAAVQQAVGLPVLDFHLGGVDSPGGSLNMIWLSSILFGGFAVGALLFYGSGRSHRVHQLDNYAGGHFLTAKVQYQYSDNFYAGLMHLIGGWYRGSFLWAERAFASAVDLISRGAAGWYRNSLPLAYTVAGSLLLLWWVRL